MTSLLLSVLLACSLTNRDRDGDGHDARDRGGQDCADFNREIFPGAEERCNGLDDDCDGAVDEIFDIDADGFMADTPACLAMKGVVDCDDGNAAIAPDAVEICNTVDDDCDGAVDEAPDADQDGSDACEDCDDADPSVFPGGTEWCDGRDNDCDGRSDEDWDIDGDGYAACSGDCDEREFSSHIGAVEICDGVDNDCDGETDEGFDGDSDGFSTCAGDCDDDDVAIYPWAVELCDGLDNDCHEGVDDLPDSDGDGFNTCVDCDDEDAAVFPGADEACDGKDSDCDGWLPEAEADADGDRVRRCAGDCDDGDDLRATGFVETCDGLDNDCDDTTGDDDDRDGDGYTLCTGDCDDRTAGRGPEAPEVCDTLDNNCDGARDEGSVCAPCVSETLVDSVYLYCPVYLSFEEAHASCLERGYDLVAFGDADEEIAVLDKAFALLEDLWWVGLLDRESEGDWSWTNGETATYLNWASGQPDNADDEDCAHALWSGYSWNDVGCASEFPYICESRL